MDKRPSTRFHRLPSAAQKLQMRQSCWKRSGTAQEKDTDPSRARYRKAFELFGERVEQPGAINGHRLINSCESNKALTKIWI